MRSNFSDLGERERESLLLTKEFLRKRLQQRATIDWALSLKPNDRTKPNDRVKRMAIVELVTTSGIRIREPWLSSWRLLTESWEEESRSTGHDQSEYHLIQRLKKGERSTSLIAGLVDRVRPRLEVKEFDGIHRHFLPAPAVPKKPRDLLQIGLLSPELLDPDILDASVLDSEFLRDLARALDSAVFNAFNRAKRSAGWDGERGLGQLSQVSYSQNDPDQFSGDFAGALAPSVKLLHAVVSRLVDRNASYANEFAHHWSTTACSIHLRLWSSLSRDSRFTPSSRIRDFLCSLPDYRFWDNYRYPEIAELRSSRFREIDAEGQVRVLRRILRLPPKSLFRTFDDPTKLERQRIYSAVLALHHIEGAGGALSDRASQWLVRQRKQFPDLGQVGGRNNQARHQTSFIPPPSPEAQFDLLHGTPRLNALERALSDSEGRDDMQGRAEAWIKRPGNTSELLGDFHKDPSAADSYPTILSWFYWFHRPHEGPPTRDLLDECKRALSLTSGLPEQTLKELVGSIGVWLRFWCPHVFSLQEGFDLWFQLWPIAVRLTNAGKPSGGQPTGAADEAGESPEHFSERAMQSPVSKLVEVFRALCPNLKADRHPFSSNKRLRDMREAIVSASLRSRLYARFELVMALSYFHAADEAWTRRYLIEPLLGSDEADLPLWHAVAREMPRTTPFRLLASKILDRIADGRLSRRTRHALMSHLVWSCLSTSEKKGRHPVARVKIQQKLRSLDDDMRAQAAKAACNYVVAIQRQNRANPSPHATHLLVNAIEHFFREAWPQELSLRSPGISDALASMPAEIPEGFVRTLGAIEKFLVPFDCWSMYEYGLGGEEDGHPLLDMINDQAKAKALLRLLNLTVGYEAPVVPDDLGHALDQIRKFWRGANKDLAFRRLSALARR